MPGHGLILAMTIGYGSYLREATRMGARNYALAVTAGAYNSYRSLKLLVFIGTNILNLTVFVAIIVLVTVIL